MKLKLCLVLTLVMMTLHRVESQCQDFITPPVDTVAVLNSFTCLTCDYPGTTNEEWFRDGSIILGDHTDLCDCEVFPDEGRICFNSVTEADVDTYSCGVIVGFGQFCVSSADLILAESPVIDKSSTVSLVVTEGNTATIPVSVTGLPSPMVQFMKDGDVLSSSSDPRVTISNTGLTITNVDRTDRGDYSIIASNSAGEDTFSRRLLVQFTPVLMVEQSAVDNNMITLTCTAIAYPQPFQNYVRWERVSDGMPLDTTQTFTDTDIDFTVTITADVDVSTCDPEGYRCVVNNTRGTTKRSVTLCSEPPVIDKSNTASLIVTEGNTATIPVSVTGLPSPTVQFMKDGAVLSSSSDSRVTISNTDNDWELTITNVDREDRGDYSIVATNIAGEDTFSRRLLVQFTPVLTVEQSAVVNNTITLTCTAIAFPSPIAVLWQSISDVMTLNSIEIFTVTDIDFTVTTTTDVDLSVCEPDGYRCVAHNRRGMIRQSVTLCSVIPPLPSQAVTVRDVEVFGTAITVKWQVTDGADVDGLVIRVSEIGSSGDVKVVNNYTVPRRDFVILSKCVGRLMMKTTYKVCIVANISSRVGEEIDCYDPVVNTLEEDTVDVSNCAQQTTAVEVRDQLENSSSSGGE